MEATKIKGIDVTRASVTEVKQAIAEGIPILGITHVTTHEWPRLDELASLTLITLYGEKAFPELKKGFSLGCVSAENIRKGNYGDDAWYELLRQGHLTIGTGGGPLDDHFDEDGASKKQGSAVERVAYFLGIEQEPEVRHLLRYINHENNSGDNPSLTGASGETAVSAQMFMLATTIKTAWRMLRQKKDEGKMVERVKGFMAIIQDHILDQKSFIDETGKVLGAMKKIPLKLMTLDSEKTFTPTLVVIKSDSERASSIIRANSGKNVMGIIQIRSNGQFCFFSANKKSGLKPHQLEDVVKALRSEIISWKNKDLHPSKRIKNNWQETRKEGYHEGTEGLYYFSQGGMIFNGSLTQPDVPGLVGNDARKFPLTEKILVDIVTIALEDKYWPEESKEECSSGKCPASIPGNNYRCPIYQFGRYVCYVNRKNTST